jgi:hypothetical protein
MPSRSVRRRTRPPRPLVLSALLSLLPGAISQPSFPERHTCVFDFRAEHPDGSLSYGRVVEYQDTDANLYAELPHVAAVATAQCNPHCNNPRAGTRRMSRR